LKLSRSLSYGRLIMCFKMRTSDLGSEISRHLLGCLVI